jgi:hypothetical protein
MTAFGTERTCPEFTAIETKGEIKRYFFRQLFFGVVARSAGGITGKVFMFFTPIPIPATIPQKLINREAVHLSLQIPQGSFNAVDYRQAKTDSAPEVSAMIHTLPEFLNIIRILVDKDRLEEFHNLRNCFRKEVAGICFPDTDQFGISMNFDKGCAASLSCL